MHTKKHRSARSTLDLRSRQLSKFGVLPIVIDRVTNLRVS